jgi:hypothetical protein
MHHASVEAASADTALHVDGSPPIGSAERCVFLSASITFALEQAHMVGGQLGSASPQFSRHQPSVAPAPATAEHPCGSIPGLIAWPSNRLALTALASWQYTGCPLGSAQFFFGGALRRRDLVALRESLGVVALLTLLAFSSVHHTASPAALVHFLSGTTLAALLAKRAARTFGDSNRGSTSSAARGLSAEGTPATHRAARRHSITRHSLRRCQTGAGPGNWAFFLPISASRMRTDEARHYDVLRRERI